MLDWNELLGPDVHRGNKKEVPCVSGGCFGGVVVVNPPPPSNSPSVDTSLECNSVPCSYVTYKCMLLLFGPLRGGNGMTRDRWAGDGF